MILRCDTCGCLFPGQQECDVCFRDNLTRHEPGQGCPEIVGDDGDEHVCPGHLVECVVIPKTVAEEQAAIVAAWKMLPSGYRTTMRAALEAAVAALEGKQ